MNDLLRSFLLAMANAALDWVTRLDEKNTVIDMLKRRLEELEGKNAEV